MSDGGDWDRWKDWIPGDPIPSGAAAPGSRSAPSEPRRRPEAHQQRQRHLASSPQGSWRPVGFVLAGIGALFVLGLTATDRTESGPGASDSWASAPVVVEQPTTTVVVGGGDAISESVAVSFDALVRQVGVDTPASQIVVYRGYLVAWVAVPDDPSVAEIWTVYADGTASEPVTQPAPPGFSEVAFYPGRIDPRAAFSGLAEEALDELGMGEATLEYFVIEGQRGGHDRATVTLHLAEGDRRDSVRFLLATGELASGR